MLGNGDGLKMTNQIDRDNEDWLLALSGEPRQGADSFTNTQAEAVRAALMRRADVVDKESPEPSEAGYHRLLFRLKREGYIGPGAEKSSRLKQPANDEFTGFAATGTYDLPPAMRSAKSGIPADSHGGAGTTSIKRSWWNPALGMAAVFVIGAALIFYMEMGHRKDEDPFAVRGGEATVLIVSDQNEKVTQLVDNLNPLGGNVKIQREVDGSVTLIIKATDKVLERLIEDRVHPDVKDGYLKLSIVPKPSK